MNIEQKQFLEFLTEEKMEYRIIEIKEKKLTIILQKQPDEKMQRRWKQKYRKMHHPYGRLYGYSFLYQMHEFMLYYRHHNFFEIFFELPCLSLTPKTFIPLDLLIQESVFQSRKQDGDFLYLDDSNAYIYHLVTCIFQNKEFSDKDIAFFDEHSNLPDQKEMQEKLKTVFFGFTEELLKILQDKEYDTLIKRYFSYQDY